MLGPTPAGKKVWQRLQGHALPLRNLDGMDPIVCGKLIDRPFPTDRLESHFRLERTTVLPSLCRHLLVLPHGSMSLTYSVVQFLGSIIAIMISESACLIASISAGDSLESENIYLVCAEPAGMIDSSQSGCWSSASFSGLQSVMWCHLTLPDRIPLMSGCAEAFTMTRDAGTCPLFCK